MEKTVTLELTHGELGILLRNFKYDREQFKSLGKILNILERATGFKGVEEVYDLKEKPCFDLVEKIKKLSMEVGDQKKIDTFDQLLHQYLNCARLDKERKLQIEEMFMEFVSDPENLDLALISPIEAEAHTRFYAIMKEVMK